MNKESGEGEGEGDVDGDGKMLFFHHSRLSYANILQYVTYKVWGKNRLQKKN